MAEVFNVLMVGVGGQGVVLASDILAEAAMIEGLDAKKSEIHGMSQRGGPVFGHVRFGSEVHSPMIPKGEADVLYALERMELLRWAAWARPEATAFYLAQNIYPQGVKEYPAEADDDIRRLFAHVVPFENHALRGRVSPKMKNTALLGAVSLLTPLSDASYLEAIDRLCPPGTFEVNKTAFELGQQLALASGEVPARVE